MVNGHLHVEYERLFWEVMVNVKESGFKIKEIITDKDSSINAIFCFHFPDGTITYCSNHCAKTLHKDLNQISFASLLAPSSEDNELD